MAEGYKDWSAGEILTAADLEDYTVKQSVMRFADSSSRTTALSGVLAEGMVSYLKDTDTVEVYDGSAWAAIAGGKILQVVSTTKTDSFTAATDNDGTPNAQWASVTGLTATITPTAATSKVLVMLHLSDGYRSSYRLTRGGTPISVGDSAGSRQQATGGSGNGQDYAIASGSAIYLDSPATTSATTYGVDIANFESTGVTITLYINRSKDDNNATSASRAVSSITLMEVSA